MRFEYPKGYANAFAPFCSDGFFLLHTRHSKFCIPQSAYPLPAYYFTTEVLVVHMSRNDDAVAHMVRGSDAVTHLGADDADDDSISLATPRPLEDEPNDMGYMRQVVACQLAMHRQCLPILHRRQHHRPQK